MKIPKFTVEDWQEIYYALETKRFAISNGDFGPEDKRGDNKQWIDHLASIQKAIERAKLI